jgi:kanamycin nucleotidyltransferase
VPGGPKPMDRSRRLDLAREIAAQIQDHYRDIRDVIVDDVLAIGVYGSLARGTDGPYSDIEMHCVVRGSGVDVCHEWSAGAWKAEVDVYSEDVVLEWASEVDVDWSLTHGACTNVWVLYDPTGFFSRLRDAALSHPDEVFQRVIRDVIVGEIYERIGKVRNARAAKDDTCLPFLAVDLAKCGACLLGLAHRHLYTTSTHMFEESLALPGRPEGYDILCRMVMAGDLTGAARIADASDAFWSGVERWAGGRGIQIEQDLERLLSLESKGGPGTIR